MEGSADATYNENEKQHARPPLEDMSKSAGLEQRGDGSAQLGGVEEDNLVEGVPTKATDNENIELPMAASSSHSAKIEPEQKDYSELLAEFEGNTEPRHDHQNLQQPNHIPPSHEIQAAAEGAAHLLDTRGEGELDIFRSIGEDYGGSRDPPLQSSGSHDKLNAASLLPETPPKPSPFDDILAQANAFPADVVVVPSPSQSPVPTLSIEHSEHDGDLAGFMDETTGERSMQSFLSDASDWLGDTSMDDSFVDQRADGVLAQQKLEPLEQFGANVPILLDVPEGWYDEAEQWHWYTPEEKEQVRLTMLAAWGGQGVNGVGSDYFAEGERNFRYCCVPLEPLVSSPFTAMN